MGKKDKGSVFSRIRNKYRRNSHNVMSDKIKEAIKKSITTFQSRGTKKPLLLEEPMKLVKAYSTSDSFDKNCNFEIGSTDKILNKQIESSNINNFTNICTPGVESDTNRSKVSLSSVSESLEDEDSASLHDKNNSLLNFNNTISESSSESLISESSSSSYSTFISSKSVSYLENYSDFSNISNGADISQKDRAIQYSLSTHSRLNERMPIKKKVYPMCNKPPFINNSVESIACKREHFSSIANKGFLGKCSLKETDKDELSGEYEKNEKSIQKVVEINVKDSGQKTLGEEQYTEGDACEACKQFTSYHIENRKFNENCNSYTIMAIPVIYRCELDFISECSSLELTGCQSTECGGFHVFDYYMY